MTPKKLGLWITTALTSPSRRLRRPFHRSGLHPFDRGSGRSPVDRDRYRSGSPSVVGVNGLGKKDLLPPCDPVGHQHSLCQAGGPVIKGGIRNLHAGQLAHQGLILEDGLKGSLADLGLIGGIGCIKLGTGNQAGNDRGDEVMVSPCPEKILHRSP